MVARSDRIAAASAASAQRGAFALEAATTFESDGLFESVFVIGDERTAELERGQLRELPCISDRECGVVLIEPARSTVPPIGGLAFGRPGSKFVGDV